MNIYAIADLHFDSRNEKPMNIFGDNWINHEERILSNWQSTVCDDDLILVPGDISWAVKLDEAKEDLYKIDNLKGTKIIGKGNHDYWWGTSNKLENIGLKTIKFLKNNSYEFDEAIICGTRGWDTMEEHTTDVSNEKIYLRELNRLRISLEGSKNSDKNIIVMLHYPPFENDGSANRFFSLLKEYKVNTCIYGHLHGEEGHKNVREGKIDDILFYCVSSDYLNFELKKII
ncbi:metallophosphoesterase [Sedimentibacter sp. MB31-C6]|uniref:metallophosphoesterase n=1 Tax=Sedimentibacter sp. MB31-C6 TaxID=3109366 RepID=UPI002DDD23EF|nr:metallophosphoesterase [Sedimentibacter sp. MB36-C1]WSI03376.1 metallophosphoesterase [Sedimentibacter sp. MB36-C1]